MAGVVLHRPVVRAWPDDHPVLPLPVAIEHALHCLSADFAAVVLESGMNRGLITAADASEASRSLSILDRQAIFPVNAGSESGTETIVRRSLERRGIATRSQVRIPGVGRVDLLIGEKLIIECDSLAYHADPEKYRQDRERDLAAKRLGYTVVRLTYEQVINAWDDTLRSVLMMIRRHDHRVPRAKRAHLIHGGLLRADPTA
ncbi:endonuclease domain-containing protein [Brachybacterium sp. GCM10030267]|uniref:endonuclease domain-containing protein n=1 Tax=Brachybacterium sp. GCM10030267 TaxID=3273381 RepID=UPI00361BF25F